MLPAFALWFCVCGELELKSIICDDEIEILYLIAIKLI